MRACCWGFGKVPGKQDIVHAGKSLNITSSKPSVPGGSKEVALRMMCKRKVVSWSGRYDGWETAGGTCNWWKGTKNPGRFIDYIKIFVKKTYHLV